MRGTRGVTSRANSVFAIPGSGVDLPGPTELDDMIGAAETFYRERCLPAVFQVSPGTWPPDLDEVLDRRGYLLEKPSEVWTAASATVAHRAPAPGVREIGELVRACDPDPAWFDCACEEPVPGRRVHETIVRRIPAPALFVSIRQGAVAMAVGLAVSGGGCAGVFSMVTREAARRRGLARRVLRALAGWAAERGDDELYLQVMRNNHGARALYERCGFAFAYPRHYRVKLLHS